MPVGRNGSPQRRQRCRIDVDKLHQLLATLAMPELWMGDDERNVGDGIMLVGLQLAGAAMVAIVRAVIGGEDHHRVLPQIQPVQRVQQMAQPAIHQHHIGSVARPDAAELLRRDATLPLGIGRVTGPGSLVGVRIELLDQFAGRVPGFMRIEAIEMQVEIAVLVIVLHPLGGFAEHLRAEPVFLRPADVVDIAPVALVHAHPVGLRQHKASARVRVPAIALHAPDKVEAGVAHVIIARPFLPQMKMVGDEIADVVAVAQHLL